MTEHGTALDDPMIGRQLGGFRVLEPLGQGGMGVVYVGERLDGGTRCALKVLARSAAGDESARRRFKREARYASSIKHPNILEVLEAGEDDGTPFMAMEYVAGGDLKQLLAGAGHLEPAQAVDIVSQVAAALDAAHAVGLMHRDVKPGNIMIADPETPEKRALLGDFGLGKNPLEDSIALTRAGHFVGTPFYTAPEEILAKDRDRRVDVYSLGCVLFECLVGEPPFVSERDLDILYAHVQEERPKPSERRPGVPAALDPVLARAMAQDPNERFATCGELAAAAQEAVGLHLEDIASSERELVLEVTAGNAQDTVIDLPDALEIGRQAEGIGRLEGDDQLSRRHARVYRDDQRRMLIEDLGSTNGTWVNGDRIDEALVLVPGDVVKVGTSLLTVRVGGVDETEAEAEAETEPEPAHETAPEPEPAAAAPAPGSPVHLEITLDLDPASGTGTLGLGDGLPEVPLRQVDGRWIPARPGGP
jgi:hypothetical protein